MRATRGEIAKIILKGLLIGGGIAIASTSPTFLVRILPKLIKYSRYRKKQKEIEWKRFYNSFHNLEKQGLVEMEYKGKQLYVSLTKEGKKKAGRYQIDNLRIKKPLYWDRKWRVLIFDIEEKNKIKREALRGKLKELKLYPLQKSVWVCPYNFDKEMKILKQFFGFAEKEMKIIIATEIENDKDLKNYFGL
jgi:DNA-binding transcriptional regulator PaaX